MKRGRGACVLRAAVQRVYPYFRTLRAPFERGAVAGKRLAGWVRCGGRVELLTLWIDEGEGGGRGEGLGWELEPAATVGWGGQGFLAGCWLAGSRRRTSGGLLDAAGVGNGTWPDQARGKWRGWGWCHVRRHAAPLPLLA